MSNILYVYGTLRPGNSEPIKINATMYDIGRFPGISLGGTGEVVCEKVTVTDWEGFDRYEGYREDDPEGSLYIRTPFQDGWIYVFNQFDRGDFRVIESGDWLEHTKKEAGSYARYS